MNLSWMFGSSMEAHHLLASYLVVWLIQGGYAGWVLRQWVRSGKELAITTVMEEDTEV